MQSYQIKAVGKNKIDLKYDLPLKKEHVCRMKK